MIQAHEKLAASLATLQELQKEGRHVFRSRELGRVHRERLLKHGFLQEITKGWVLSTSPDVREGDSTPWYVAFWEFCAHYCRERFGEAWHLSPEQSLLLHAENTIIPKQVIIYSPQGTNNTINLPFGISFYDLKQKDMPPQNDLTEIEGVRVYGIVAALMKLSESFYQRQPIEAQIAVSHISDAGDVLPYLLSGGHSVIAGRLAGALRYIGKGHIADEILTTMRTAEYAVHETNPFAAQVNTVPLTNAGSPVILRLQTFWHMMRGPIIDIFPPSPGLPKDHQKFLQMVEEAYTSDSYHSLSIEGYRVSLEMIERVRRGDWNPARNIEDQNNKNALAARGYWQAFQLVKADIANIITKQEDYSIVSNTHREWYRALFGPSIVAGIISSSALGGYRNHPVFLRGSRYVPPRFQSVREAMPVLFDLLSQEREASVRAVLAHWLFGYIHPYPDGNGRMARFLMNVMLTSGGYPWTIIHVEDRKTYLSALEAASVDMDITPFAHFIAGCIQQQWENKTQ